MRHILLISDTHGFLDPLLLKHIHAADEVWHAGDIGNTAVCDSIEAIKPLRAVYGNIDGADLRNRFQEDLFFTCDNLAVLITHIGGYPGTYPTRVKQLIHQHKPGLFVDGHSHILKVMFDKTNNLLFMNPGACGNHGFHQIRTALRFDIDNGAVKNLDVMELGKRSALTSRHGQ